MRWLDNIPTGLLAAVALLMLFAPFVPEPHLWQKLKMLAAGTLSRPLDIFDLFWHLLPAGLFALKLYRLRRQ
jgi:hypothetical protein